MAHKAIKVILTYGESGIVYPDFNQIPAAKRGGIDWKKYVDINGGWHYDKAGGFGLADDFEPDAAKWCGVLVMPEDFADEALARFAGVVSQMNEAELEKFINTRAGIHKPESIIDGAVLQAIQTKQAANMELTDADKRALDENDSTPGIVKNKSKYWADIKEARKLTIK